MKEYINITWQDGPVKEVGVNGCQASEVIDALLEYLTGVHYLSPDRETETAIRKLQEAGMWLGERTRLREIQRVEGTHAKHRGVRIGDHYGLLGKER